jgi:anaerobic magnesium-protoporphyrin IX monomethyl ester cyclase
MKVLLSTPPGKTTELWPPLGLLYIASSVKAKRGDEVKVIDAFCENLTGNELSRRVMEEEPDVFGINCSTHTFLDAIGLMKELRILRPEMKLVLGGYHATFAAERILKEYPFVDYIIKGEGERSFPQLLQHIEDGSPPSDVGGIGYLDGGRLIDNPFTLIEDLDSLPFPDRSILRKVDYGYFFQDIRLTFGKFTTLCTSRGCPYKCTYCSCAELSLRKWRPRSAESVLDELEMLYNKGYECCVFVDDNFTHRKNRVEEICDGIKDRRIKMQLYCEGRVDAAPYELLKKMKGAGINVIYFGVESASQHVLDYYQKTTRPDQAVKAIQHAKDAGMIVVTSYIIGAANETMEDIDKTIEMIGKTRPHGVQINILDCLIGTPIWNELERNNIVGKDDWKTNHRIYEYLEDGIPKDELQKRVVDGYASQFNSWKSKEGLKELPGLFLDNSTASRIILGNLLSRDTWKMMREGLHTSVLDSIKKDGLKSPTHAPQSKESS